VDKDPFVKDAKVTGDDPNLNGSTNLIIHLNQPLLYYSPGDLNFDHTLACHQNPHLVIFPMFPQKEMS